MHEICIFFGNSFTNLEIAEKKIKGTRININKYLHKSYEEELKNWTRFGEICIDEYDYISNKIVLLEKADPGFDWIFSKNISGLITKFGGAASHMAIRCAEFGIPAAIGCGDILYNRLKTAKVVDLDCKNKLLTNL